MAGKKIPFTGIIANDPPAAIFLQNSHENQLNANKAKLIYVLFSNIDWIASGTPIGTHNFYVNDGMKQPRCKQGFSPSDTCHHWYGAELMNYYIRRPSKSRRCFTRIWCKNWQGPFPLSSDGKDAMNEVIKFFICQRNAYKICIKLYDTSI